MNSLQKYPRPLILASASPRRASLMHEHGIDVRIVEPPFDEPQEFKEILSPRAHAEAISYFKARSVCDRVDAGWVLGGDTLVASLEKRIFGKPEDRDDARRIISTLAGTTHYVITGVSIVDARRRVRMIRHDVTAVVMRSLTDAEIEAYLDSGEWAGKAGAYGIQDYADAFVVRLEGSFTNVVGFPMELVAQMLEQFRDLVEASADSLAHW